jgi:hypothetical protein
VSRSHSDADNSRARLGARDEHGPLQPSSSPQRSKLRTAGTIPISEGIVTITLAHMAIVKTMRDKAGDAWIENDFVFPNEFSKYRRPDNLTTHCLRLFKRLKIDGHHLHDLRATATTAGASWAPTMRQPPPWPAMRMSRSASRCTPMPRRGSVR